MLIIREHADILWIITAYRQRGEGIEFPCFLVNLVNGYSIIACIWADTVVTVIWKNQIGGGAVGFVALAQGENILYKFKTAFLARIVVRIYINIIF